MTSPLFAYHAENINNDQQREKEREREAEREREKEREKERERDKHRDKGREDRERNDSDRMRDRDSDREERSRERHERERDRERGSSVERFSKEGSPVASRGASQEVSPPQPQVPEGKPWNYPGLDIMATGAFWQNYSGKCISI